MAMQFYIETMPEYRRKLPLEPAQPRNQLSLASEMWLNLLEINDDCLTDILSNLNYRELSDAASTCSRLLTIACRVFKSLHRHHPMYIDVDFWNSSDANYCRQTVRMLQNFGELVTDLVLSFDNINAPQKSFNTRFINAVTKHCTTPPKSLVLICCQNLQMRYLKDATGLFRNVRELRLYRCDEVIASFLSDAKQLTKLTLNGFHASVAIKFLTNDFPRLQSLVLADITPDCVDMDARFNHVLRRHKSLTEIAVNDCPFNRNSICELPELKKLSITDCGGYNLDAVAKLDQLTSLTLATRFNDGELKRFFKTSKSARLLEELELDALPPLEVPLFNALVRLTKLKCLTFMLRGGRILDDSLLEYLHRLKDLRALTFEGALNISTNGLVSLVRHLPRLERLVMAANSNFGPSQRVYLKRSTYSRICEIYRTRGQKMVINNFGEMEKEAYCGRRKYREKELYAESNQYGSVEYISLDPDCDYCQSVRYI